MKASEHVTISVFGRDRKGVVAEATSFVFRAGGNIEELVEQVTRREFYMTLVASWAPGKLDRRTLDTGLSELGTRLKMEVRVRHHSPSARPRMALFMTKETHCADALLAAARSGALRAEPVLVAANHPELAAYARRWRVPFVHAPFRDHERGERALLRALDRSEADFAVLARFMKILSPRFTWRWRNRIINIHPSLLPAFPGAAAYRQAYDHGVKVVGVTAHFATPDLDGGPIICQDAVRLRPNEPLASIVARGRALEAKVLLRAVKLHVANRLDVYWGTVKVV
ncbi:MAG: formyltetrahydrofolate deformylase [bacterium]